MGLWALPPPSAAPWSTMAALGNQPPPTPQCHQRKKALNLGMKGQVAGSGALPAYL